MEQGTTRGTAGGQTETSPSAAVHGVQKPGVTRAQLDTLCTADDCCQFISVLVFTRSRLTVSGMQDFESLQQALSSLDIEIEVSWLSDIQSYACAGATTP